MKSGSACMMSSKKMFGDLPPSSTVDGMMFSAAHFMMCEPTGVEPVKAILAMRLLVASASPASRPKPCTTLSTPGGSRSPISFHQHGDAQRRLLGRFEHHAVTGGQRRGEFPGGHQQREVPRDDLPDHAQRLVNVIRHGVAVDLGSAAFLGAQAAGEVAEVVDRQRDVGVEGFAHGFAVVPGFGDGQQFQVLFDAVGDFQQDQRALLHRGLAPRIGGGMGGVQGLVDVFGGGAGEFGNRLAGDRRDVGEVLAFDRRRRIRRRCSCRTGS